MAINSQKVATMKLENIQMDRAVLVEVGVRLARVRIDLGMTQAALAREAGIGKRTLERLEAGAPTQTDTLIRVLRVLKLLERLDAVIPEITIRPRDVIKRNDIAPKRAPRRPALVRENKWKWGDEK
jgi:transcriptional regulator with XRE-family HTH domain